MSEIKKYHRDIMQYESKIWACADTLIACSIKQSDFPAYMMPFFALVMLEGRMLNKIAEIEANEGITYAEDPEAFLEAFRDENCGYNEYIVRKGKHFPVFVIMTKPLSRISETTLMVSTLILRNSLVLNEALTTANISILMVLLPNSVRKRF